MLVHGRARHARLLVICVSVQLIAFSTRLTKRTDTLPKVLSGGKAAALGLGDEGSYLLTR
jgi:hypothetical protein